MGNCAPDPDPFIWTTQYPGDVRWNVRYRLTAHHEGKVV